ncbi:ABC transporter substrate-binding protein [Streptomyces himalayensis]|uniref:ABC transporter substrate-binding protein n=1 Tax=Streptomyces himalayensis TaxID=2820085 RepID=UPI00215D8CE9|nr:extracellular solute-binding protein [Streptomyces himalayensis]
MTTRTLPALIAAVTAGALLAACSGGTKASSGGDSKTLTLASVDQGSIEDVVKAFEKANPGVEVRYTTSGADQYQQQIRTQLSSGTAPDVMSVWPGNGNPGATYVLAEPGYLRDLSDQPWAAKLPDAMKSVAQYEGKTYNAVFGQNGIGASTTSRPWRRPGSLRRTPGRSCWPSARPRRPREPPPSRWATRTTG